MESETKPVVSWAEKEKELMSGFELQAFEALEREFQQVLSELQADPSLDKFRVEYEKLHRAMKKSHESEKRLIKKCRELNSEIQINAKKVETVLLNSEEDQILIMNLREEIGKAWKMVDATQEKEAKAKENIQALKQEIAQLSGIVERSVSFVARHDSQVSNLEEEKLAVLRERDRLFTTTTDLKKELAAWTTRVRVLEEQKLACEHELITVKDHLQGKRAECDREIRRKERLEKELRDFKNSILSLQGQLKIKESEFAKTQEEVAKTEGILEEQRHAAEKSAKLIEGLNSKIGKLQYDLEEQLRFNSQLLTESSERMVDLKMKDDEINAVREEIIKARKMREATLNKLKIVESQKVEVEKHRDDIKAKLFQVEKENELQRKLTEAERKRFEESVRERDVLTKMKTQTEDWAQKQTDMLRLKETVLGNLEIELQQYRDAAVKQDHVIQQLERERLKASAECADATEKYMKGLDAMHAKDLEIFEAKKNVEVSELAVKQQKALFEVVRTEKNLYSKRLVEAQDEINQAKRKLQISNQMVQSLKDQLESMDASIEKGATEIIKVEREREGLADNATHLNEKIKVGEDKIASYKGEIANQGLLVDQAKEEVERLTKEYNTVKGERDTLAIQLNRRDEELAQLYEKVRVQESTLHKGQTQYVERVNELRALKVKLNDLKREQFILRGSLKSIGILKRELSSVGRELLKEQVKVRAMSEELETPQNVHRWRTLEATDPTVYEMICKVQTLQKRLIVKTDEVVEKDLLIKEKEKLYIELQKILARQPGPEAAQRINDLTRLLGEKTRQLKAMSSELFLYQSRVKEYKSEIDELRGELQVAKRRYVEQKEKEQKEKEKQRDSLFPPTPGRNPTPKKAPKPALKRPVKKNKS